jgi:lipoyl(octanoyl) transferase
MARFVQLPGLSGYREVHDLQRRLVEERARDEIPDTVLLLEHAPVITLGRKRDAASNVLAGDWPVVEVERGGDVTLHAPGQLVAYPIVKLEGDRKDLHRHLHALEDAVIGLCAELGLDGGRDARNTGVWLPCADGERRKVCSIGIACKKWVTFHGLALNVEVDLAAFDRIRPCGFESAVMTRLADHGIPDTAAGLAPRLAVHLAATLGLEAAP